MKNLTTSQEKAYLELSDKMHALATVFGLDQEFVQDALSEIEQTIKKEIGVEI